MSEYVEKIDNGFLAISKDFKKYKNAKLKEYREKGIQIDVSSHEAHWFKVFVMGTLAELKGLEAKKETKTVKTKTVKTKTMKKGEKTDGKKRKTTRKRKTRARSSDAQLGLGI